MAEFEDDLQTGNSDNNFVSVFTSFISQNYILVILFLIGITSIGAGLFFLKDSDAGESRVEVLGEEQDLNSSSVTIDIQGAVAKPGLYELPDGSRIADALTLAGGLTENADSAWTQKTINRAAKLTDGQKIYIPSNDEQINVPSAKNITEGFAENETGEETYSSMININTASSKELESLWGIGEKIAQYIIEQRPYSSPEELVEKKLITSKVFERIKNQITVY